VNAAAKLKGEPMPSEADTKEATDKGKADADAKAKAEAVKAAKAERALEEKKAMTDYDRHLQAVQAVQAMTDTPAWQDFYANAQKIKRRCTLELLTAEKTRDVVRLQETVKAVGELVGFVKGPADDLKHFVESMPLFAGSMKTRADFDAKTGRVVLHTTG